ncbi:MAG: hypothetical protein LBF93_04880 [Zoogloeaceae bacterium]|jgi:hypothetical protein|nr:hypothetical protein [Zoogloeaceae bacterium]
MKDKNRASALAGRTFLLCAALLASPAHAAPDCIGTFEGNTVNLGPVRAAEHGYCVTLELLSTERDNAQGERATEWLMRTTYESGEIVDVTLTGENEKNVRLGIKEEYISYGPDAWLDDDYSRNLPKPAMPAYMTSVSLGKGGETGEWTFSALFIDKEGRLMDGMRAYIRQLKAMGFIRDAHDKEIPNRNARPIPGRRPDGVTLLAYWARNNAGFLAATFCVAGGHLCHLRLDNPTRAHKEANKRQARKTREEEERKKKQKFDDDFFDATRSLPDE